MRSSSPAVVAPENETVFITVHWDIGTDIELELDFGDGTALYSWNWQVRVLVELTGTYGSGRCLCTRCVDRYMYVCTREADRRMCTRGTDKYVFTRETDRYVCTFMMTFG